MSKKSTARLVPLMLVIALTLAFVSVLTYAPISATASAAQVEFEYQSGEDYFAVETIYFDGADNNTVYAKVKKGDDLRAGKGNK